jgi:hypothetical protein
LFVVKNSVFFITNLRREKIYWEGSGRISSLVNNFLHESWVVLFSFNGSIGNFFILFRLITVWRLWSVLYKLGLHFLLVLQKSVYYGTWTRPICKQASVRAWSKFIPFFFLLTTPGYHCTNHDAVPLTPTSVPTSMFFSGRLHAQLYMLDYLCLRVLWLENSPDVDTKIRRWRCMV